MAMVSRKRRSSRLISSILAAKGFLNIRCTVNRKNRRDCVTIVVMEDLITEEEMEDFLIFFDCPFDIETGRAPEIRGNYIQLNFYIHDWEMQEYCCDSDFDV